MEDFDFCPYEILELNIVTHWTKSFLRSRFLKLARLCHPDKFPDPSMKEIKNKEFVRVNLSYKVLTTPKLKHVFDTFDGSLGQKWMMVMNIIGKEINTVSNDAGKLEEIELEFQGLQTFQFESTTHQKLYNDLALLLEKTKKILEAQLLKTSLLDLISVQICRANFNFHEAESSWVPSPDEQIPEHDVEWPEVDCILTTPSCSTSVNCQAEEEVPSTPPPSENYSIEWSQSPEPNPPKKKFLYFKCFVCLQRFEDKKKWKKHGKKHNFPKPCTKCSYVAEEYVIYNMHMRCCRGPSLR